MPILGRGPIGTDPGNIAAQQAALERYGGSGAVLLSAVALLFSAYSLWDTSLKQADLRLFVPSVISYSAPYNNSNFEMIGIPVTIANEGARTGTVLQFELAVTDPKTNQTKRFYSADFGRWTMEKTRALAYEPFAPMSLAGRTSRTDSVLFYTRGTEEKPDQLIREPGTYQFTLTVDQAEEDGGWLGLGSSRKPLSVAFERDLLGYDARAFNNGTLSLYSKEWRAAVGANGSASSP